MNVEWKAYYLDRILMNVSSRARFYFLSSLLLKVLNGKHGRRERAISIAIYY